MKSPQKGIQTNRPGRKHYILPRLLKVRAGPGEEVVYAGGYTQNLTPSNAVDIYDAVSGQWTSTTLYQPRFDIAATAVGTKLILAGGATSDTLEGYANPSSTIDIYDSTTGLWSNTSLSYAVFGIDAATVGGDAIFAYGQTANIYDGTTGTWSSPELPIFAVSFATVATIGTKAVFAGGGSNGQTSAVDIYDSSDGLWTSASLSQARENMDVITLGENVIFAGGGGTVMATITMPSTHSVSRRR
jgi:hypothetical protein